MRIIDGVELDDGVEERDDFWDGWDDLFDEEPEDDFENNLPDFIQACGGYCDPLPEFIPKGSDE